MADRISVIGDGAWATVCAIMLCQNGHRVRMWSPFAQAADALRRERENRKYLPGVMLPESLEVTGNDAEALAGADWAVQAIPSQFARGVWGRLSGHCPKALPICSVAKGIENVTLQRPTQVLLDVLGGERGRVAAVSGPSIAPEIARGLPATVVAAGEDARFTERVQACLSRPYFRVYTNSDLAGVELAGASKNVIAVAAGILDGLEMGDNAKAGLLMRGLVEITRLGLARRQAGDVRRAGRHGRSGDHVRLAHRQEPQFRRGDRAGQNGPAGPGRGARRGRGPGHDGQRN